MNDSLYSNGFEVSDYSCMGDASYYENHVFTIRIWIAQDNYTIRRTYSNFCDVDALLRKKYPKTEFPVLPLAGAPLFSKQGRRKSSMSLSQSTGSSAGSRGSFHGRIEHKKVSDVKRVDNREVIHQKKGALTDYLKQLVAIPVIAISSEIADFFDEESPDGFRIDRPELSEINMLLIGEEDTRNTVKSKFEIVLSLDEDSAVVWRFSTKTKDIGFSVEFKGQVAFPYQRHCSHEAPVVGLFEAPVAGEIKLMWDNTYSKVTWKLLTSTVKIVSKNDLIRVKTSLAEIIKERHIFDVRRAALRVSLEKICEHLLNASAVGESSAEAADSGTSVHSKSILTSLGTSGTASSGARGSATSMLLSEYQQEIHRLQDETRALHLELSASQYALHDRSEELDALREEHEKIQSQNEIYASERIELTSLLDQTRKTAELEGIRRMKLEQELENVRRDLEVEYSDLTARLQRDIARVTEDKDAMELRLNQLKTEKKQLKAVALKFKADLEAAEQVAERLRRELVSVPQPESVKLAISKGQDDSEKVLVGAVRVFDYSKVEENSQLDKVPQQDGGKLDTTSRGPSLSAAIGTGLQTKPVNDEPVNPKKLKGKEPLFPENLLCF